MKHSRKLISLSLLILLVSSCAVKWVADYSKEVEDAVIEVAKKVDLYYSDLISITHDDGTVSFTKTLSKDTLQQRARQIDNELYAVLLKNQARPLNKESTEISSSILEKFWRKYNGDIGTSKDLLQRHRNTIRKNFEALLKAEKALDPPTN